MKIDKLYTKLLILNVFLIIILLISSYLIFTNYNTINELKTDIKILNNNINKKDSLILELKEDIEFKELFFYRVISFKDSMMSDMDKELNFNRNLYKFNWDNICYWVEYYKIKQPDIVKSQILLETNFLTSEVCTYNHNLFGMREPYYKKGRKTIGSYKNHAVYNNYIESIEDYKIWQERMYKYDKENYYTFLLRIRYAQDKRYIYKLRKIEKEIILKKVSL